MSRFRGALWQAPVVFVAVAPSIAAAQPSTFEGAAVVPLAGPDDLVKARAQAHADAFAHAVEQAVAEVAPEGRSRLYLILGRARDYVRTYRVLQEGEVAGQFQVRIEAQIDILRLQRDLQVGSQSAAGASSRTFYLCTTSTSASAPSLLEASRAFLAERALPVEILPASRCSEPADPASLRTAAAVLILGLTGPGSGEPIRGTQPPLFGAQARVEWRVYVPAGQPAGDVMREAGEAVAFGETAAAASSESERLAVQSGLTRVLKRPGLLTSSPAGVVVSLEGVGSYAGYQQLLRVMAALPGVSRVEPRRYYAAPRPVAPGAAGEDPSAQVLLHTTAPVEVLGAALGRSALTGMRVQVAPVGPGALRLICAPEGALPTATPDASPDPAETDKVP